MAIDYQTYQQELQRNPELWAHLVSYVQTQQHITPNRANLILQHPTALGSYSRQNWVADNTGIEQIISQSAQVLTPRQTPGQQTAQVRSKRKRLLCTIVGVGLIGWAGLAYVSSSDPVDFAKKGCIPVMALGAAVAHYGSKSRENGV